MKLQNALLLASTLSILAGCTTTEPTQVNAPPAALPVSSVQPTPPAAKTVRVLEPAPEIAAEAKPLVAATPTRALREPRPEPDVPKRVSLSLKQTSAQSLDAMDQSLDLSNAQYNAIAQILAEREIGWKALYKEKRTLTESEFDTRRWEFFRVYRERLKDVFTPEQASIWANRAQ